MTCESGLLRISKFCEDSCKFVELGRELVDKVDRNEHSDSVKIRAVEDMALLVFVRFQSGRSLVTNGN